MLGAGDAFMSGFLRGYLRDEPIEDLLRATPTPAAPSRCRATAARRRCRRWTELAYFFAHGSRTTALRKDARLEQIHWSTTRTRRWPQVLAMAFDHRAQLEAMADAAGAQPRASALFQAALPEGGAPGGSAAARTSASCSMAGSARRRSTMATGDGIWIGRPIELPGSLPLRFEGGADVGCTLREWPAAHCVKCLVFYHPDDPEALRDEQEAQRSACSTPARQTCHELLLEIIPSRSKAPVDDRTLGRALERFYELGVFPDWWKLPDPGSQAAWDAIAADDRAARPVLPRRAAAGPRCAAGRARGELRARRAPAGLQGLRGRPHDLRRAGPRLDKGEIDDAAAVAAHGRDLRQPDPGLGARPPLHPPTTNRPPGRSFAST